MSANAILTMTLEALAARDAPDKVLNAVRRIAGVKGAGLIAPKAKSASSRALAFVEVDSDADLAETAEKVGSIDGVKSCSIPPARYAVGS